MCFRRVMSDLSSLSKDVPRRTVKNTAKSVILRNRIRDRNRDANQSRKLINFLLCSGGHRKLEEIRSQLRDLSQQQTDRQTISVVLPTPSSDVIAVTKTSQSVGSRLY